MNERIQRELQGRIEAFAVDVTAILQRAVADAVAEAIGSPARGASRTSVSAKSKDAAGRRTRQRVQQEAGTLLKEVQRKGDRRMEEIAKSLRTSTKALVTPMKKLLAAKKVKKSGLARGTKYRAA